MTELLRPVGSPRIERLTENLSGATDRADRAEILERFWKDAEATGTPLVDPGPDPGTRIVTFLWREQRPTTGVLVLVNTVVEAYRENLEPARMSRLEDTDVWWRAYLFDADLRAGYQLLPLTGGVGDPDLNRTAQPQVWMQIRTLGLADPLNHDHLPGAQPGVRTAVLTLPAAPAQDWLHARTAADPGTLTELRTADRPVWVHEPPGRTPTGGHPLLVVLDGDLWAGPLHLPGTLDHLRETGRLPGFLTVMVGSARAPGDGPEAPASFPARNQELADSARSRSVLTEQVLPLVSEHRQVTDDPARRIIAGQSLGATSALQMMLVEPILFGRAVLQSAALPPDGGPFSRLSAQAPPELRIYLEVGRHEWRLLPGNRAVRDNLAARGVLAGHHEYGGGHDPACWRVGIAAGLQAVAGLQP